VECSCGRKYRVPAEVAGKKVRCKECGAAMDVPAASPPPEPVHPAPAAAPVAPPEPTRPAPPAPPPAQAGKKCKRIMVVEDDRSLLKSVSDFLGKVGYEALAFDNADMAVEEIDRFQPHLVVSDIMMPGRTGLVFCSGVSKKLYDRGDGTSPRVKILVMSALDANKVKSRADSVGANEYLCKPFSMIELREVVEKLIGKPSL